MKSQCCKCKNLCSCPRMDWFVTPSCAFSYGRRICSWSLRYKYAIYANCFQVFFFFLSFQSVACNQGPSIAYQRKPFIQLYEDGGWRGGGCSWLGFIECESLWDSSIGRWEKMRLGLLPSLSLPDWAAGYPRQFSSVSLSPSSTAICSGPCVFFHSCQHTTQHRAALSRPAMPARSHKPCLRREYTQAGCRWI